MHFLSDTGDFRLVCWKDLEGVCFPPGARVRPSTNHWVSYQPTIGLLLGFLGFSFKVLVLGFSSRVLVLGFSKHVRSLK